MQRAAITISRCHAGTTSKANQTKPHCATTELGECTLHAENSFCECCWRSGTTLLKSCLVVFCGCSSTIVLRLCPSPCFCISEITDAFFCACSAGGFLVSLEGSSDGCGSIGSSSRNLSKVQTHFSSISRQSSDLLLLPLQWGTF